MNEQQIVIVRPSTVKPLVLPISQPPSSTPSHLSHLPPSSVTVVNDRRMMFPLVLCQHGTTPSTIVFDVRERGDEVRETNEGPEEDARDRGATTTGTRNHTSISVDSSYRKEELGGMGQVRWEREREGNATEFSQSRSNELQ